MKIVDFQVERFTVPAFMQVDTWGHQHPGPERQSEEALIRIITDEGVEGIYVSKSLHFSPTDTYAFERKAERDEDDLTAAKKNSGAWDFLMKAVRPQLIGEDPLCRERIWRKLSEMQRLYSSFTDRLLSYIDCALWDIAGKAANQPVYKLLGGHRQKLKAYASTMPGDHFKNGLSTPEEFADFAEACVKRGYQAVKLHTWMDEVWTPSTIVATADPRKDVEACRAVRDRVGPDIALMLDSYHSYNRQQALYIGKELEKLHYAWFEEPMNEYSVSSYAWLCEQLDIPILGPELHAGKLYARTEWVVRKAADILRAGVNDVGGLTPFMKIVHLAEAFNMPLEIHSPGLANMHGIAAMSIPGEYYERGLLHPFLNYDVTPPWLNEIVDPMDEVGYVIMPTRPGLGWNINSDYIKEHRV